MRLSKDLSGAFVATPGRTSYRSQPRPGAYRVSVDPVLLHPMSTGTWVRPDKHRQIGSHET
jgi:hypothetical protein